MATRRSHPKSRNGCIICKQRKIKCDESRPTCANCLRYGASCSFTPPKVASLPVIARTRLPIGDLSSQLPDDTNSLGTDLQTTFTNLGILANPSSTLSIPSGHDECRDFELLHHYCTFTADSLSQRLDRRHIWKVVLPQVGYEHDFVRHGVLALSAIHKAYLNPSQRQIYLVLAAHYQSQGLSGFRAILPRITYNNWRAVFCFATIVIVYVYSLPLRIDDLRLENPVHNLLELFTVVRGLRATLEPFTHLIAKTEFAPVVHGIWIPEEEKSVPSLEHTLLPPETFSVLSSLRPLIQGKLPLPKTHHYERAIDGLETCTKIVAYAGSYVEPGMVIWWSCILDETIIKDVESSDPHALILLAHFLVLMSITERVNWSVKGWAKPVLEDIERRLRDRPRFIGHLHWPKAQINL